MSSPSKFRTDFYQAAGCAFYAFREAVRNDDGTWNLVDIDEATMTDGTIIPDETASYTIARDLSLEMARHEMGRFEHVRKKGTASVVSAEDGRFGNNPGWQHFRHM